MSLLFWSGPGGALLCNKKLDGFQELDKSSQDYYGGQYMVGETIDPAAQREIAKAFGGEYQDNYKGLRYQFYYVDIKSSDPSTKGWINLFFGDGDLMNGLDRCIALINDPYLADLIKSKIHSLEEFRNASKNS